MHHNSSTYLPSGCWKDVLVPLVPTSFDDLPRVGFIFLFGSVVKEPYVIVDVKAEEGTRFSPGLVDDKIVESVMLNKHGKHLATLMRS
jgi:hypothetical protein